jgi:hypothetical protein
MDNSSSVIETGVDKLVNLIRSKKKISVPEAAKFLGVGPIVVEEWADFLEEEGIISIEYKFATPYLIERKATKEEVKQKEKEFHNEKETFVRKAEVTLSILDKEGEFFQKFKDNFQRLKKELGSELTRVEAELLQLEKFENLKKGMDTQIMQEEKEFQQKISLFEAEIRREQQKYMDIINNISEEEAKLDKDRLDAISLQQKESIIKQRLQQFEQAIAKISESITGDETTINNAEKRIGELKKSAEKVKTEIMQKSENAKILIKENQSHKEKIMALQKSIIEKVEKNNTSISSKINEGRNSTKSFREFFKKKVELEKLVTDLEGQKNQLEQELIELIKKAKAFHISSKSSSLNCHVQELKEKFELIKKKKASFDKETQRLTSLLN